MGRGTASRFGEAFSMSGILKILESVLVFVTLLIHRHGDNGKYIFFATARDRLKFVSTIFPDRWRAATPPELLRLDRVGFFLRQNDPDRQAIDAENLGNGTLVTYAIISPVLLACYVLDGRYAIQSMFLEWVSEVLPDLRTVL